MGKLIQQYQAGYWDFRSGTINDWSGNGKDGSFASAPVFTRDGLKLDGTDDAVTVGDTTQTIKTFAIHLNPTTTSEDIADMDGGTHTVEVAAGTITATGFDTPTIYVDGVASSTLVANKSQVIVVTTATGFSASNLSIGKETNFFDGIIGAAFISTSELTAAEVAQLTAELKEMKWPSKPSSKTMASSPLQPTDTANNTVQLDLEPKGGTIKDLASGNNNGTISENPVFGKDILGSYVKLAGGTSDEWINIPTDTSLDGAGTTGEVSIECWFRPVDVTDTSYKGLVTRWNATGNRRCYALLQTWATEKRPAFSISGNGLGTNYEAYSPTTDQIQDDQLYHIIATGKPGTGYTMYINGVAQTLEQVGSSGAVTTVFAEDCDVRIGASVSIGGATNEFAGQIWPPQVHSRVIGAAEALERYKKGARLVQWKSDWGTPVSIAARSAGFLEDTDWEISSGTWKVSTDTINGETVKVLECVTDGIIYRKMTENDFLEDNAYGSWEFWLNKAQTTNQIAFHISDSIGGTGTGNNYSFLHDGDNTVLMREGTNSIIDSNPTTYASATWNQVKFTRRYDNQFELFMNGASVGTGSKNSHKTMEYFDLSMDAGDKIALGSPNGNYAITKYLGVI